MKVPLTGTFRGVTTAAAALVVAVLLTGCGASSPGTAAVVDGQRIEQSDLDAATLDLAPLGAGGQTIGKKDVLLALILRPFVFDAAQRRGTMVSQSEARAALAAQVPDPSQGALDFAQASLVVRKLPQQDLIQVQQRLAKASITVNPRYGTFDPTQGMVAAQQNWLVPTATPAATPGAQN
ncbi:MAG TPA: hypothetical protein VES01_00010 [Dermatophilaceae bacterium]|nr:hypothetical protein [Dermatophilaceae bacterium]